MRADNAPVERRTALIPWDLWFTGWFTALALLAMMVLTFVDVVGRYVFAAPIFGATEIIQALLAATLFSALGMVSDQDAHITVDLFDAPLEKLMGRPRRILISLVSFAGLLIIGIELARVSIDALEQGRRSIVLGLSMAWFSLPGAVMCVFAALVQLVRTVRPS